MLSSRKKLPKRSVAVHTPHFVYIFSLTCKIGPFILPLHKKIVLPQVSLPHLAELDIRREDFGVHYAPDAIEADILIMIQFQVRIENNPDLKKMKGIKRN